jgi:hypothetical protein
MLPFANKITLKHSYDPELFAGEAGSFRGGCIKSQREHFEQAATPPLFVPFKSHQGFWA